MTSLSDRRGNVVSKSLHYIGNKRWPKYNTFNIIKLLSVGDFNVKRARLGWVTSLIETSQS